MFYVLYTNASEEVNHKCYALNKFSLCVYKQSYFAVHCDIFIKSITPWFKGFSLSNKIKSLLSYLSYIQPIFTDKKNEVFYTLQLGINA